MKTKLTAAILGLGMLGVADLAIAAPSNFRASLDGYQAVPTLSLPGSTANATFRINGNSSIDYTLNYDTAGDPVQQVHVHFGRPGTIGGVVAFNCSNLGSPAPAGTPLCPATPATVSGTWTAAEIVNLASAQGIAAGEIVEVIAAIRAGALYVCVHTNAFPGGSIRSALVKGGG